MRKLILIFVLAFISITDSYGYSCDETFYGKLRYGNQYTFYDEFSNNGTTPKGFEYVSGNYTEQYDYNGSSSFPIFEWTNWFSSKGFILNPGESGKVLEATSSYPIHYHPPVRSTNNLVVQYEGKYFENVGGVWGDTPKFHTECKYYEITWCGDGILDTDEGEACDTNDATRTGWGAGGCNTSCQPIANPVCNAGVTGAQTTTITAATANLCSTAGETVTNFSSSVSGNTTNYTWNCTNGTTVFTGGNCSASFTPVCNAGVTGAQTSVITASTPNLCAKAGETVTNFSSSVSGNTTNYTWNCTNGTNTFAGGNCSASFTTTPSSSGGGSSCQNGPTTGAQSSPVTVNTPGLCFGTLSVGDFKSTVTGNTTNYTWTCAGISGPLCAASFTSGGGGGGGGGGGSGGGGGTSGGGSGKTSCGDGRVQRPSAEEIQVPYSCVTGTTSKGAPIYGTCTKTEIKYVMEECDFGNEADWSFCKRDTCTYVNSTIPSNTRGEITIPNGGAMVFGPTDNVIIGAGMNPYIAHSLSRPFIRNESDYDLYFDELCVVYSSGDALNGSSVCTPAGIVKSGETVKFNSIPDFTGKNITSGNFADNRLITTIKHAGVRYDTAYFAAPLDVRVAQSSIATVGGGTSYVSNTSTVGNISKIADNGVLKANENKNFVGVGVSTGDISSYSNKIKDALSVKTVDNEGKNYSKNINKLANTQTEIVTDTSALGDFESYNGIENVFILKNKNFVVEANTFKGITGSRTYIIENGNLVINANIDFPDNIAFVVKGGDIQINKNVTLIDGTYISIVKDSKGGKIEGIGGMTTNILNVSGSLYGNINGLISKRTYVKQNSNNQIDVGTIVSFGSSLFRKPSPLISTFISEYLQADKVSK